MAPGGQAVLKGKGGQAEGDCFSGNPQDSGEDTGVSGLPLYRSR